MEGGGTPINQLPTRKVDTQIIQKEIDSIQEDTGYDEDTIEPEPIQQNNEQYVNNRQIQKVMTLQDKIIKYGKQPLLVSLIVMLMSYKPLLDIFVKNIPKLADEYGSLNMLGLVFIGVVGGVLFYIVKKFL